jgi:hypothetical protein
VLEVRRRARRSAERRRIEWAAPCGEEQKTCQTAADLEATRVEVLVRQAIACEVEDRPQEERRESRSSHSACDCPCGHMECDDQSCQREQTSAQP